MNDPAARDLAAQMLAELTADWDPAERDEALRDITEIRVYAPAPEPVLSGICEAGIDNMHRLCREPSCTCTCDCHGSTR